MPDVMLPFPEPGKNEKETIQNLTDTVIKLRKELEFLLYNLDDENVLKAKRAEIAEIFAGTITTDQLIAGTAKISLALIEDIEAQNIVTNTFVTQTLYADKAYIAELTVDQLDTSDKVAKYLANDTSDVNYIKTYDQYIEFITASTLGGQTAQAKDRNGTPIYWIDDTHAATTTEVTAFPVMIYQYTEQKKMVINFEDIDGVKSPMITMGIGNGIGNNMKAYLFKDTLGAVLRYITSTGVVQDIRNGENGIEFLGDTSNNYYSATNTEEVIIDSSGEAIICSKQIAFKNRSKVIVHFSAKMTVSGALTATAKTYVDGIAWDMQPESASSSKLTLAYSDDKKGISAGIKTISVKLQTDANTGTISTKQAKLIIYVIPDPMPTLYDVTDYTVTVISATQLDLAWTNPS